MALALGYVDSCARYLCFRRLHSVAGLSSGQDGIGRVDGGRVGGVDLICGSVLCTLFFCKEEKVTT